MKPSTLAIAALIAAAPTAYGSTVAEREYQRGYNDCSHGRYDQNQHGESYKKGCRAAEDGQKAQTPAGHQGSTVAEREYKRGFDDCSHGRYDQNQHGESYKKGCRAAEDGQKAKAHAMVNYDDLRVGGAMDAQRGLEGRGFVSVDGSQSNLGFSHLIMYNRKTGQCVDLETKGDKVMTINDVTNPKCR
jgi:hypothetical protein